jgi:hypothetical protein
MLPILLYIPGFSGILFNSIELIQKIIDDYHLNKKNIYIYINDSQKKIYENLNNRYTWFPKKVDEQFIINNRCNIITSMSDNSFPILINKYIENCEKIFLFHSNGSYKWLNNYYKDKKFFLKIMKNKNKIYSLFNNKIKSGFILSTLKEQNFVEDIYKIMFNNHILQFNHGIYTKYYKKLKQKNKYYLYLDGILNYISNKKESPFNESDLQDVIYWCNKNNIDIDINIKCDNPSQEYKGLIYYRDWEYCSRLINEFLYYKKPIWIMKYNKGLDYYITNNENKKYPFLLPNIDYYEIQIENKFIQLL